MSAVRVATGWLGATGGEDPLLVLLAVMAAALELAGAPPRLGAAIF